MSFYAFCLKTPNPEFSYTVMRDEWHLTDCPYCNLDFTRPNPTNSTHSTTPSRHPVRHETSFQTTPSRHTTGRAPSRPNVLDLTESGDEGGNQRDNLRPAHSPVLPMLPHPEAADRPRFAGKWQDNRPDINQASALGFVPKKDKQPAKGSFEVGSTLKNNVKVSDNRMVETYAGYENKPASTYKVQGFIHFFR